MMDECPEVGDLVRIEITDNIKYVYGIVVSSEGKILKGGDLHPTSYFIVHWAGGTIQSRCAVGVFNSRYWKLIRKRVR